MREGILLVIKAELGTNGAPTFIAFVDGTAIYLDNFAIKLLAKGDALLRQRFVSALNNGADLLFSMGTVGEIVGPQGASSTAFRVFLDELGPHWFPVESLVHTVMERESKGYSANDCAYDREILTAYFRSRTSNDAPGSGRIIDLSENFFKLGMFIEWVASERDWIIEKRKELDEELFKIIKVGRAKAREDRGWLDQHFPRLQFDRCPPATFVHTHLLRNLILDRGDQLKEGDGADFCHAVIGSAFANFATLDKHWKRRIENLPKPNKLARIYYEREIEEMITDIESQLTRLRALRVGARNGR
jgi:hypothetical protein